MSAPEIRLSSFASTPHWRDVLSPSIYLISFLPVMVVLLLLRLSPNAIAVLLQAGLGVLLIQHSINVLNDKADWILGADTEKPNSWVAFHRGNLNIVTLHGWLSLLAGIGAGVSVVFSEGKQKLLLVALPLVLLGYLYNSGRRPLSYTWLGESVTGVCYGGAFACLFALVAPPILPLLLPGTLAFAALSVAVLLSHQPVQVLTDAFAGKRSFAVRFGPAAALQWARHLATVFWFCLPAAFLSSEVSLVVKSVAVGAAAVGLYVNFRTKPSPRTLLGNAGYYCAAIFFCELITHWEAL